MMLKQPSLDTPLYFAIAWSAGHNNTWTAQGGYTKREEELDNNNYERHASEDQMIGVATTTQGLFLTSASNAYAMALATFLPATTTSGGGGGGGGTTTLAFVHQDHLGSTNAVTDGNGTLLQTLDYYPYGSERISTGNVTDRHFIGERYDKASQLSYLNARYYLGSRGQFLSQDPVFWEDPADQNLENPQSLNSYSYANGNPIINKDPNGRQAAITVPVVFVVIIGMIAFLPSDKQAQAMEAIVQLLSSFINSLPSGTRMGGQSAPSAPNQPSISVPSAASGVQPTTPMPLSIPGLKQEEHINFSRKEKNVGTDKPEGLPSGSKPIDKAGLPKRMAEQIKSGLKSGPRDSTWIDPKTGDIYTNEAGKAIKSGNIEQFGKSPGRGHGLKH